MSQIIDSITDTLARAGRARRHVIAVVAALATAAALIAMATPASAQIDEDADDAYDNADLGAGTIQPGDRLGESLAHGDFDGDGDADLAIGIPSDGSVGGSVRTVMGGTRGPAPARSNFLSQGTLLGAGEAEIGDGFGYAVAAGDFDGDGYDDLAIGVPFEDHSGHDDAGAVEVVYGSAAGLDGTRVDSFTQRNPIKGIPEPGDRFGFALATGDFDQDGNDDLAIGVPGESVRRRAAAGTVNVVYGSGTGLDESRNQLFNQRRPIVGFPEVGDEFGHALAAADFDADGDDDLAIGIPFESLRGRDDAGAVSIIGGSPGDGLAPAGNFMLNQRGPLQGIFQADDNFGRSLAAGSFDEDQFDDLAIGVPGEDRGRAIDTGAVNVVFGSIRSLTPGDDIIITQAGPIPGVVEAGDEFGWAVAAGDIDGDDLDDLAIGIPGEGLRGRAGAGGVLVVYTDGGRIDAATSSYHSQIGRVFGIPEAEDRFADALTIADLDEDGVGDLIVGVPGEGVAGATNAGLVQILYGG